MTSRSWGTGLLAVALVAGVASSCSSTKQDVDLTPTARTSVDAHIGKSWTADSTSIADLSSEFTPNQTVFAVVNVPGKTDGTMQVRWMFGGQTLEEHTVTLQKAGFNIYPYRLTPPAGGFQAGEYKFEVYINNDRVESETFTVKAG